MYASTTSFGVTGPPFNVAAVNKFLESLTPFLKSVILKLKDFSGSTVTLLNPRIPNASLPKVYSSPRSLNLPVLSDGNKDRPSLYICFQFKGACVSTK